MWLLDTETITLSQQSDDDVDYAILSHRWGNDEDEVSFADIKHPEVASQKKGYEKIKRCCEQAWKDGYKYAWVDTCCIDKSSSAELQEAINSMYRWYERSGVCYAYLQDVSYEHDSDLSFLLEKDDDPRLAFTRIESAIEKGLAAAGFQGSDWFTRGWTLQELLAPKVVRFFNQSWNYIGDRDTLVGPIHQATGIRRRVLQKLMSLHECCIAERMSWAACRKTKRIEDQAYSLFGIFQVHLPMLYGEREAAFQRLQREILKTSEDDTLFAWTGVSKNYGGLLAPTLENFRDGASLQTRPDGLRLEVSGSNATERSIGITADLIPWSTNTYLAPLGCITDKTADGDGGMIGVGIYLRVLEADNNFARIQFCGEDLAYLPLPPVLMWRARLDLAKLEPATPYKQAYQGTWAMNRSISVRQLPFLHEHQHWLNEWSYGFYIGIPAAEFLPYPAALPAHIHSAIPLLNSPRIPATTWNAAEKIMWAVDGAFYDRGIIGALKEPQNSITGERIRAIRDIHFGFDQFFNPVLFIRRNSTLENQITIDPFLDWSSWAPNTFVNQFGYMVLDHPRDVAVIEEAHFWNEIRNNKVIDHIDRNFWAIKGDRKSLEQAYTLPIESRSLQIELRPQVTIGKVVWSLFLHENTLPRYTEKNSLFRPIS